jgi:hypothetical protein
MTSEILSPTQTQLKWLFWYDPKSGIFRWRHPKSHRNHPWDEAGAIDGGYRRITIGHKRFFAHRLAWVYMTGQEPFKQIDHIDGDKLNNRWCNLREATNKENGENKKTPKNNTTGVLGVSQRGARFEARIRHWGVCYYSKRFETLQEAAEWRKAKENELFTHHINTQKEST